MKAVVPRAGRSGAEAALKAAGFVPSPEPGGFDSLMPWRRGGEVLYLMRDDLTGNSLVVCETDVQPPEDLPRMGLVEVDVLLGSDDARDRLAGLQGTEAFDGSVRLTRAAQLLGDVEMIVATRAAEVVAGCLRDTFPETPADLADALFALPGWRREKLQMLRWWMRDRPSDPSVVAPAVGRALADRDWELAVTAMLAAGVLGLKALAPAIRKARLPAGSHDGATRDECHLVLALRDACLTRLGVPAGKSLPPGVAEVLDGDPDMLPLELRHFAAALSLPLPVGTLPEILAGIELTAAGPRLAGDCLLCWISPGNYRLGDAAIPKEALPNPPRVQTLETGFYIDATPRPPASWDDADAKAKALSERLGITVRLPSADEFEMAARGPDGRRFPWGAPLHLRMDLSPLGLSGLVEGPGEWLDSKGKNAAPVCCGRSDPVPSHRRCAKKLERRPFRLVLLLK